MGCKHRPYLEAEASFFSLTVCFVDDRVKTTSNGPILRRCIAFKKDGSQLPVLMIEPG